MAHKLTLNQSNFVTNVERAAALGVEVSGHKSIKFALLGGLSYCRFNNGQVASLTDDYLNSCEEVLYDYAVQAGQQNNMKWAGFIS